MLKNYYVYLFENTYIEELTHSFNTMNKLKLIGRLEVRIRTK